MKNTSCLNLLISESERAQAAHSRDQSAHRGGAGARVLSSGLLRSIRRPNPARVLVKYVVHFSLLRGEPSSMHRSTAQHRGGALAVCNETRFLPRRIQVTWRLCAVVDRYDLANAVYENDCDECSHSGVRERIKCGGRPVCCLRFPA